MITGKEQKLGEWLLNSLGRENLYETDSKLVGPDYLRSDKKRQMDLWGSRLLLLPAGLLFGAEALAIAAIDRHNPFVRIKGPNGVSRLKLQTMKPGAQQEEEKILKVEKNLIDWSEKGDPRITWTGKLVRKTSFDELPTLIDVKSGKFYLVGPKMLTMAEYDYHVLPYADTEPFGTYVRLLKGDDKLEPIKYGFLGPYILAGRKSRPYSARAKEDVEYMEKVSWKTDYRLVMLNAVAVLVYKGK